MTISEKYYKEIRDFKAQRGNGVRQEKTGERNLEFSQWIRDHCRPSSKNACLVNGVNVSGFVLSDLDFIFYDYNRKMMLLLEVKINNGAVQFSQSDTLRMLDSALWHGSKKAGLNYLGWHILRMSGTTPSNSEDIRWDGELITREQCWRKINMIDDIEQLLEEPEES
jgi:hypothetical protein